jgi:hypothetical protein
VTLLESFQARNRDRGKVVIGHAETVKNNLVELGASAASKERVQLKKRKKCKKEFIFKETK